MDIKGSFTLANDLGITSVSGAFTKNTPSNADLAANVKQKYSHTATFTASKNWTGSTSSNGAHAHTITLTKSSLYKTNFKLIQPTSLGVKVKTRYR